jgi:hypothetical protein
MNDDVTLELSILIDNGLIDQFESYEIPSPLSLLFILEGTIKAIGRVLKAREDVKTASRLIVALDTLTKRIEGHDPISRYKVSIYAVCSVFLFIFTLFSLYLKD